MYAIRHGTISLMKKFLYFALILCVAISAMYIWKVSQVEIECEKEYSLGEPCVGG